MTNDTLPAVPRPSRLMRGLLYASLALNLVVIGGAASALWRHRHHGPDGHGLSGFVHQLPQERREPLHEFLKSERAKVKPIREEIAGAWKETNELLGQEPFDKDKMKAAMTRMNETEARLRATIADALVETAARMTPQERQAMKAWRERKQERGQRRWRRHWGEEEARD